MANAANDSSGIRHSNNKYASISLGFCFSNYDYIPFSKLTPAQKLQPQLKKNLTKTV